MFWKPAYILSLLLVLTQLATAQHYQCIPDKEIRFFTNDNHYLRAIRIDSVKTINGNKVQYPFKTARGAHNQQESAYIMHKGGSWLGNTITILPDGTHLFENHRNDTVVIKTQAALNNSWVLYDDTAAMTYEATVTVVDTMTILPGVVDSVKVIIITARDSNGAIANTFLNGQQIIISKRYGFAQVLDMFMFPAQDGTGSTGRFDYFFDIQSGIFRLSDFKNPSKRVIYDFFPGEVYEYEVKSVYPSGASGYPVQKDSIMYRRKISNYITAYTIQERHSSFKFSYTSNPPRTYTITYDTVTLRVNHDLLFDMDKLPEEWGCEYYFYYNPNDTNFCQVGRSYRYGLNLVRYSTDTAVRSTFEPCGYGYSFQEGMGQLFYSGCYSPTETWWDIMHYAKKHNTPCGQLTHIEQEHTLNSDDISVYPNPATDKVTIKLKSMALPAVAAISNLSGQVLRTVPLSGTQTDIAIEGLPQGLYLLQVNTGRGSINKKLSVVR